MNTSNKILLFAIISFLSPFLVIQESNAHTDSLNIWRFVYEVSDVNYKERGYNDLMNLDVKSDGSSFFYSIYNEVDKTSPSFDYDVDVLLVDDSRKRGAHYKIYREAKKNELTCTTDAPDNFFFKEENINIQWNIIDKDTMTVCGYPCKKATASYAGRTWTVWFSEELPITCGPWKLSGLPGLILSASDTENYFKFYCVGMEQTKREPWKASSKNCIKCTNEEYQKQLRLQAADPVNYALRKAGLASITAEDATIMDETGKSGNALPKFDKIFMEKMPDDEK